MGRATTRGHNRGAAARQAEPGLAAVPVEPPLLLLSFTASLPLRFLPVCPSGCTCGIFAARPTHHYHRHKSWTPVQCSPPHSSCTPRPAPLALCQSSAPPQCRARAPPKRFTFPTPEDKTPLLYISSTANYGRARALASCRVQDMDSWFNATTLYMTDYEPVGQSMYDFVFERDNVTGSWLRLGWLTRWVGPCFVALHRLVCLPFFSVLC